MHRWNSPGERGWCTAPFLRIAALADHKGRALAPHFVMEIHVHLSTAYPPTAWVEENRQPRTGRAATRVSKITSGHAARRSVVGQWAGPRRADRRRRG
ncbi:hypothetical protein [Streptomyces sp. NPDC091217]|uniref:hypothetical protein n=1 Tax=Streptomyces sp. NPDC091217 TaxID=3365975 RepID=UPI00381049D9